MLNTNSLTRFIIGISNWKWAIGIHSVFSVILAYNFFSIPSFSSLIVFVFIASFLNMLTGLLCGSIAKKAYIQNKPFDDVMPRMQKVLLIAIILLLALLWSELFESSSLKVYIYLAYDCLYIFVWVHVSFFAFKKAGKIIPDTTTHDH